jgi:hypothetical protein
MQTKETAALKIVEAMGFNYNYVREHSTLTPAEKAGINLELGEKKIENQILIVAKKGRESIRGGEVSNTPL